MGTTIQFCGAAETVTGSKHLLQWEGRRVLVDCGLFQGPAELRARNFQPLPFVPKDLDAVVVTHAHMDHIGYLPRLVQDGYDGPIYATPPTIRLSRVSLPDSGRLQEEEAAYRNRKGYLDEGRPVRPLYTERDAYACLKKFEPVQFFEMRELSGGAHFRFMPAGHILGSAFAEIYFPNGERILMSGDLGRFDTPIICDPTPVEYAEFLVIESTYGDRLHPDEDPMDRLEAIVEEALNGGSCIVVPSFSIGRTQELLFYLKRLQLAGRIGRLPIFVDSPMATSASRIYLEGKEDHDREMKLALDEGENPLEPDHIEYVRDREQSKALNARTGPMMVIAGSGMANGGRVVHHLLNRLGDPSTIVLFTGFQAQGTLGRRLLEREPEVEILGRSLAVRARIDKLNSLSAHCDQGEMLRWLGGFRAAPRRTFIVHGEPPAQQALQQKIGETLGWDATIPRHLESFDL